MKKQCKLMVVIGICILGTLLLVAGSTANSHYGKELRKSQEAQIRKQITSGKEKLYLHVQDADRDQELLKFAVDLGEANGYRKDNISYDIYGAPVNLILVKKEN